MRIKFRNNYESEVKDADDAMSVIYNSQSNAEEISFSESETAAATSLKQHLKRFCKNLKLALPRFTKS